MNIEKTREGNKLTIKLDGRLDTNTAPELEKELKEALPGVGDLVFDFSDLKYISSAGLRLILSTQKTMNQQGTLVIENVNDMVMEIFETTGFSDVLTIKETEPLN
ncbi:MULTISPECIES: STAS domain-containing protein [Methanobacterium]|jgi:anti-sigma B factor antagonist|uniref:Anti-sigma F factor antagonist n=1 Tax=Methanobacterium subterraneum TaxID=59277 RepID=A0A2H4VPI9_9EURY|nr:MULTISPECIES: STAS domain-containing protein [Methanobacterium]MBW4257717.1 STAS domain-containing protein [Methanobacterium sp. YSL]PKL71350.1 MAG: anti-sigma factor antagonist [Methanobacteriales archaeon HGW-Methanobacteriales-2]AUB56114.1 anti-sigma F factor antagonist [Methanobacterium subterraneum]AUB56854.1 anti-sigma F factor antagonist [Methanobacterium sp. MZ-A1]AUB60015.1 anti-sigma F factor antagonist [Methanobacterium subterraneum]